MYLSNIFGIFANYYGKLKISVYKLFTYEGGSWSTGESD